ncbi:hypothetical protein Strain138_000815 [Pseudogemmatithrix spongiicola]|uniref:Uncharacterized protein n=1 Tax=Pseudogemmatithrix spongiicola TaxID=3062599 RepID=A0AA49JT47_9BACT|nr:hypothetical protein Strain138_000815 [Gemmatimonadaceae bacterium 'strain 138']WKW14470.1 hypothetical protein Strain318_000815 [Gemmatimonadaceae bacterium 'strain 318']
MTTTTATIPPLHVRRRNILIFATSYPLLSVLLWITMRDSNFFALTHLAMTILILWQFAIERVGRVGKAIGDDIDSRLDERQLALRNAAYLDAYRIASGIVLLGVIWIALGIDLKLWWVPSTYDEWNIIFSGLFIYLLTLPSAILAWREPDRHDDPELLRA